MKPVLLSNTNCQSTQANKGINNLAKEPELESCHVDEVMCSHPNGVILFLMLVYRRGAPSCS